MFELVCVWGFHTIKKKKVFSATICLVVVKAKQMEFVEDAGPTVTPGVSTGELKVLINIDVIQKSKSHFYI